ncbi:MAG: hypothetical protein QM727_08150 [Niabella sp.]
MELKTNTIFLLVAAFLIMGCGAKKKKAMTGEDQVAAQEFVDFYPEATLPFAYTDSSLQQKANDSLLIAPSVFNQFVPDSLQKKIFGGKNGLKFYALARFANKANETYLLTRVEGGKKRALFVNVFDKELKYIAGVPILKTSNNTKGSQQTATLDNLFNLGRLVTQKKADGSMISGQDVYVLNTAAKQFLLVMTDSLGDGAAELINPIDTLPVTHKFAGDYKKGEMNLISIRDGEHRNDKVRFFIHIEDDDNDCQGELKGEALFIKPDTAEYRQGGDPCVLQFIFAKDRLTLKEVEGCGSRLGNLQCSFNVSFLKEKKLQKAAHK